MATRTVVRVSVDSNGFLRALAHRKGVDVGSAADLCISMARRRFDALAKHAAKKAKRKSRKAK